LSAALDCERIRIYYVSVDAHLTPKEQQLLSFIEQYQLENGSSPTVREMREYMQLKSDGFIVHCIKSLESKGAIEKGDTPRSIRLLPSVSARLQGETVKLPVVGTVPAGSPVLSEEYIEDWMTLDQGQVKDPDNSFVLKVRGDSMINAGIFEGDHVIVSRKEEPRNGDNVVALVDGGSTVKRYVKTKSGSYYLHPENPDFPDIYPEESLEIQGVVVGLVRWFM